MAVDSTPERSLSVLFSSSRAAEATTGWTPASPRCGVVIMARKRHLDRPLRIGQEVGDAGERLVRLGIEDMQDRADQQRVAGLLPVVAALQRAFGIDQDVGDVLDVAHFPCRRAAPPAADCRRRTCASVGSNSSTRPKRDAQARRELPVLALDVVNDADAGQVSSVGTTRPTPLPDRVGAKHSTCSGPSWRR